MDDGCSISDSYDSYGGDGVPQTKYWIYVVINEYYEDLVLQEPCVQLMVNFGKSLGHKAKVNLPLRTAYHETRRSVLNRHWDDETRKLLHEAIDLYMLVIPSPLSSFKPSHDKFILMWLPDALTNPLQYVKTLDEISKGIIAGRDIFQWHVKHSRQQTNFLKKLYSAIQARPGVLGFSIDLKQLISSK